MAVIKEFKKTPVATVSKVSGANSISQAIKIANEASRGTGKSAVQKQNNASPAPVQESKKQKPAVDQMWERASSTPQRTEMDDYRKRILGLQRELQAAKDSDTRPEAEKMLPAWAYMMSDKDALGYLKNQEESGYTDLLLAEQERKRLQDQLNSTRDEMNYRANMGKIDSMSEEQKQDLEMLANSGNGVFSRGVRPGDERRNDGSNPRNQRISAKNRLIESGIGETQLKDLVETYQRDMNRRNAEQATEEAKQKIDEGGFWGDVAENVIATGRNLVGSVTGGVETVDQAIRRATGNSVYSTADPNRPGYLPSILAGATREATSEQILGEDPTLANKAANLLYKGGTSAVDNVLRLLAGGGAAGSLALAGMGSFQDSYRSAAERGADDSTALLYGSVTAALEVATEFLPTEHLLGAKSAKECESLLRQAFVQAGLEIPGEEISLWGEIIADAYIMGDKSENNRLRAELIANGYSKEQADNEIMRRNLMESAETALTTLVSSGGSVYVQGKVDSARNKLADMEARGLAANNAGQAQNVQQAATVEEQQGKAEQRQESPAADEGQQIINAVAEELAQQAPKPEAQTATPEMEQLNAAIAETLGGQPEQETDNSTGNKSIKLYRGYNQSDDPTKKNLTSKQSVYNILGREDPNEIKNLLPLAYYTENEEDARFYADMDVRQMDEYRKNGVYEYRDRVMRGKDVEGLSEEEYADRAAKRSFLAMHGRESNAGGRVERYDYTPVKVLDLTELGDITNVDAAYKVLADKFGIEPNELDNILSMGNNFENDFPSFARLRNAPRDNLGTKIVDLAKKAGYDSIRYSEDGNSHYAIITDREGWDKNLIKDSAPDVETPEMEQLDRAIAETMGSHPAQRPAAESAERADYETEPGVAARPDYYDEFENWGTDPNRDGVENPLSDRSYSGVGKRSVKAYMYENPAVKPFYQEQAAWLLSELADSTKGERTYQEGLHYESGGEKGWTGTKRHTSESIAELLDQSGMTYDQIERGLNAIIKDNGQENNAVSKRIEFIINDRLMNGYTDFYTGQKVPGNAEYLNLLRNQQSTPDVDTQNVSMNDGQQTFTQQNPGIKGTGAAEVNFSGKPAYNATLSEDNAQADRRDDVRPMELPERDINGGNVSAVTGNVYGSKITPDDFASLMEEPTAKGDFSYMPISNDRATQMAKQSIERSGNWETAYADWAKAVARGQAGAEMSARGALLLNKAAQDGNKGRWLEILSDMRELGTNTAQGLQAFRLIRTLTPPDKLEFAKVAVRKLTESFARRSGLQTEITIDESLIKEYENAQTDKQRDKIMGRIQQNVADQIPSTFMDKFNALRYLNMLGNLKTNARNVAGNVGAAGAYRVKDTIAAGLERAAYTVSGGKTELTKSVFVSPEMKNAAAKDFEQYAGIISDGGKFSTGGSEMDDFTSGVIDKRTVFKIDSKNQTLNSVVNAALSPLEAYRKVTNWAMNNKYFGDEAFGRAAYSRALAGYLQANGIKETDFSKIDQTLLNKARAYAVKQAQEATFHDNNTVSKTLVKLQKDTGGFGQGILPFAKTPANVVVRAEEFSPLGFLNSTIKTIQKAAGNTALAEKNGGLGKFARAGQEITGADLIDSWAKSFTGAGLFVLGAWLADQGWLTGSPDEDEDKAAFDKLNGIQPFSLMLPGGGNITIDFLSPVAMTMFMGADAAKIWNERGDFTYEKLEKMATSITEVLIQMSCFQGVEDSLNNIKYADNNLGQFLINAGLNYFSQGLTNALLGQLERSTEKERMTTYVDKNSSVPAWMQKQLGKISQKIPGWDYQQTAYIDARGQTQENMGGAEGLLYNFASPGYIDKKEIDAVSAELYRLNDSATFEGSIFPESPKTSFDYTGKDGTVHKDFSMDAEQADTLKRVTGQTGTKILSDMVQSKDYAALTDNQKAKAVKLAYEYAREKGRGATLEDYPEMSGWMAGIDGKEGRTILQKVAQDTLQSAVSDWAEAIKNGWDTTADADEMESAYKVYDSMSLDAKKKIDDSISGDAAAYLEIRSGGVATEKYISVVSGIKSLKPEKDYSNVRDIQIREEIAENRSLSERERDIVMKAYMPDYDPKSKSPKTTELKYDEVRKLGVSAKGYSDSYRDYLDASGSGKRRRTIKLYMDTYGWDRATAQKVYDLYAGYYKPWEK